jgi:YVTN family beta-propeller protein
VVRKAIILFAISFLACSGKGQAPSSGTGISTRKTFIPQETSQIVIYARSKAPVTLPLVWGIRKISVNLPDGGQIDVPRSQISLSLSGLTGRQSLLAVSEFPPGSYTGITVFTDEAYSEVTGQPVATDGKIVKVDHDFTIAKGKSKTLTLLIDLKYAGDPARAMEFKPVFSIEDENQTPIGKLVYVANEQSSNVSVIDKSLKRVVYNVYVGTNPFTLGADQRRRRLYIGDRRDGVLYEMDMTANRLVRATELEYVDEPVQITPIPEEDMLMVLNYGSHTVYLVDGFTSQIRETIEVPENPVDAAYSSVYDMAFILGRRWGTLSAVDFSKQPAEVDTIYRVEREPIGIAIDDTKEWLFISNSGSIDLMVFDIRIMGVERTVTIGLGGGDVAFDPFGRRLYIGMMDTFEVLCLDPFTGVMPFRISLPSAPGELFFERDEKQVYVTVPDHNAVAVIDPMTQRITHWIETGLRPSSIAARL